MGYNRGWGGGRVTGEEETSYRALVDVKNVGFTPTGETLMFLSRRMA